MRLLVEPGRNMLVLAALSIATTVSAEDWGFPTNFNVPPQQSIQGRELEAQERQQTQEGASQDGFNTPGFNIPFRNDLSFSEFGGSPFGDTPATFRQFLTGVGGAARSAPSSDFSERETPKFEIPTLGRNLVEVPTYKREVDARQLDRFQEEFIRPQPVYVHPKRNSYQHSAAAAAAAQAATESYERPQEREPPVRRAYLQPVYKPELRQVQPSASPYQPTTSPNQATRQTTMNTHEQDTIRPFSDDDFSIGFPNQRFEIQKEVVQEATPSYMKPTTTSSTTTTSATTTIQSQPDYYDQDAADYPRAREELDNPFIVDAFNADSFMKNDVMKMTPYVNLGNNNQQHHQQVKAVSSPLEMGSFFNDEQPSDSGNGGSFFDTNSPAGQLSSFSKEAQMDSFFKSKNDEIAAYFDSKPAKDTVQPRPQKNEPQRGSFKPPTLIERFNTPVVQPSIPYSPAELSLKAPTQHAGRGPSRHHIQQQQPLRRTRPEVRSPTAQSPSSLSQEKQRPTEKFANPPRVSYQGSQSPPAYPPKSSTPKSDGPKPTKKPAATKKPYRPPQHKYEKKNFRAPVKVQPKNSDPHPIIRIKRPEDRGQQAKQPPTTTSASAPEFRNLDHYQHQAPQQQQRYNHQPIRPSEEYNHHQHRPAHNDAARSGQLEIVEVHKPKQQYDNSQEIITLSPEIKRFSSAGGKQSFNVKVKASFSPSSDPKLSTSQISNTQKVEKRNGRLSPLARRRSNQAPLSRSRSQRNPYIRRKRVLKY